jgi:hypothetical protein
LEDLPVGSLEAAESAFYSAVAAGARVIGATAADDVDVDDDRLEERKGANEVR